MDIYVLGISAMNINKITKILKVKKRKFKIIILINYFFENLLQSQYFINIKNINYFDVLLLKIYFIIIHMNLIIFYV